MIDELREAIALSLKDAASISPNARTWEVDCLVGLFRTGLPLISGTFNRCGAAANLAVDVGGIFCHQSPKVVHRAGTCEIGDLLIVVRYATTAPPIYRALLVQTKMADGAGLSPGDPQYVLYHEWPSFTWAKTGSGRTVTPPEPHPGAQVSTLDVCADWCPGCSATASVPDQHPRDLADVLFDVYHQATGRSFDAYATAVNSGNTDWDRAVWDMLTFTVGAVSYRWRRAKHGRRPRGFSIDGVFLQLADLPPTFFDELLPRMSDSGDDRLESDVQTMLAASASEAAIDAWTPRGPLRPTEDASPDDDPGGISTIFVDISADDWPGQEQTYPRG